MPANTSPDNIQYPVSTDPVAPLEAVFANMATSVQNALIDVRTELTSPEVGIRSRTTTQAIANGGSATEAALNVNNLLVNGAAASSNGILVPTAGVYSVDAIVNWASNNNGYRQLSLRINGSPTSNTETDAAVTGSITVSRISDTLNLAANSVVSMEAYQTSGGSLNITRATLSLVRVYATA